MKIIFPIFLLFYNIAFTQSLKEVVTSKNENDLEQFIAKKGIETCEGAANLLINYASRGDIEKVNWLLEKGADINATCKKQQTALMIATILNQKEMVQFLMQKGASLSQKDFRKETAYEMAKRYKHHELVDSVFSQYLFQLAEEDGPHIFVGKNPMAYQFQKDKNNNVHLDSFEIKKEALFQDQDFCCYDQSGEEIFSFKLYDDFESPPSTYEMPKKLLAISDIEGQLQGFIRLLKASKVVDEQLHWIFGKGHLVLNGDFFDRGNKVTECLWLIYKLEHEAKQAGGVVHFILGNHEEMNINGDLRYLKTKYLANSKVLNKTYTSLYSDETILGKWLASKNVMERIGDILFCHAGLSVEFWKLKVPIKRVNKTAHHYLRANPTQRASNTIAAKLFSPIGPMWYRGNRTEVIPEKKFTKILKYYKANKLVIGHTTVPKIQSFYHGKLIAIDVPHVRGIKNQQALLIDNGKYYVVNGDGTVVLFGD